MPHPKRKVSRTRRDKRRTHDKLTARTFYMDPVSGEATLYHRVNLTSGYYKGQQYLESKGEE